MSHRTIINIIADQADELLEGVSGRAQARAAIEEEIAIHHHDIVGADRRKIIDGVMAILENEGFFESGSSSEAGEATDDDEAEA